MKLMLAVLAVAAMPLAAQQPRMGHDDRMMEHMNEMMAPMMSAMAFNPDHILAHQDSLQLTAAQLSRLTALQGAAKKAHENCQAGMKPHMAAIAQGLSAATPDTAALKQHFDAAHAAMEKGHWTMLATAVQARAVLTEEQRARVERWAAGRKSEHGERHGEHH